MPSVVSEYCSGLCPKLPCQSLVAARKHLFVRIQASFASIGSKICLHTSAPNEGFPQHKGTCHHRSERWPASCFRVRPSLECEPCSACCAKQTCTDRILHRAGPSRVGHTTVQRQEAGLRLCMYSAEGKLLNCLHGHFLMQNTRPPSQSTTGTSSRQISHSMPKAAPTMLAPRCENHMLPSGRVYRRVEDRLFRTVGPSHQALCRPK